MKLRYFNILFFLCASISSISAQSIYSALHHDDPYDVKQTIQVKEITTSIVFYNTSGTTEAKKEVTRFNDQNKIISEIRYDETGKMTDRLTWTYDQARIKSLSRKYERWMNALGYTYETAYYEYDNQGYLIQVIDKNPSGKMIRTSTIINDENGYPIELTLVTDSSNDFGKETAEYDFENNSVVITSKGVYGNVLSKRNDKIDFSKYGKGEFVNQYGDPLKLEDYVFTYEYDRSLNWVKQIRYRIVNNRQVKNAEFTRKIKYLKK